MSDACCAPGSRDGAPREERASEHDADGTTGTAPGGIPPWSMVDIPAGTFRMGDESVWAYPGDGEGPVHEVGLDGFSIDIYTVTNDQFAQFVESTGHVTDAERYGWSFVFGGLLPDDFPPTRGVAHAPWWRQVDGAAWSRPEGPDTDVADRGSHPVVHVSWNDAQAYCDWTGTRLPTEAEWECAARGGAAGLSFPWGDDLEPDGEHRMNAFQGTFPAENTAADGHVSTAPVDSFAPNTFGLHNVTGNVWEWCADWYDPGYYRQSPAHAPTGPPDGTSRVQRGGSYLCHISYCRRYRVGARMGSEPESSTGNLGFRVAI